MGGGRPPPPRKEGEMSLRERLWRLVMAILNKIQGKRNEQGK